MLASGALSKTASMVYWPRGRLQPGKVPLFLDGQRIQRVRTCKYLGLTIDERVTSRPALAETTALSRRLLSTFRPVSGSTWGLTQGLMLTLRKRLLVPRVLYLLPNSLPALHPPLCRDSPRPYVIRLRAEHFYILIAFIEHQPPVLLSNSWLVPLKDGNNHSGVPF